MPPCTGCGGGGLAGATPGMRLPPSSQCHGGAGEGRPSAARSPDLRPRPGTRPTPQPRSPADAAPVGRGRRGRWLRPGEKLGVAGSGRRPWPVGTLPSSSAPAAVQTGRHRSTSSIPPGRCCGLPRGRTGWGTPGSLGPRTPPRGPNLHTPLPPLVLGYGSPAPAQKKGPGEDPWRLHKLAFQSPGKGDTTVGDRRGRRSCL